MLSENILRSFIRNVLNEGGNVVATKCGSGEAIMRQLSDGGEEVRRAQRIPVKKMGVGSLEGVLNKLFIALNSEYTKMFKDELWPGGYKATPDIYSGSSSWIHDNKVCNNELCELKPTLGDIDIMIPRDNAENLLTLLCKLQTNSSEIIPSVTFIGPGKATAKKVGDSTQINCIFEYTSPDGPTVDMQIDFERVDFSDSDAVGHKVPSWFSRMAHSSKIEDMRIGAKGFAHKLLLRSIYTGSSVMQGTIVTGASTPENYKTSTRVNSQGEVVPQTGAAKLGFSVDHGLRQMAKEFGEDEANGTLIQKMLSPAAVKKKNAMIVKNNAKKGTNTPLIKDTVYEKEFNKLFLAVFPDQEPTRENQNKFSSFVGLIDLMSLEMKQDVIDRIFSSFMAKLIGPRAQILYANDAELEIKEKRAPLNYFIEKLNVSEELKLKMKELEDNHKNRLTNVTDNDLSE
jgi:hypothetical protein